MDTLTKLRLQRGPRAIAELLAEVVARIGGDRFPARALREVAR